MAEAVTFLSVIIPVYNEAERLPKTLQRLHEYLSTRPFTYEILVVLDGPTDGTREVLSQISGTIANLRVIDRVVNRGKGYTVKEGMLKATGRIRLFSDADNSTDIAHIAPMLSLFDSGCDVVIASRHPNDAPGARQTVPQPLYRRILSRVGNIIVQFLVLRGIWDTHCGFKAFRPEAAIKIFSQTEVEGWGFDIEVLALARAMSLKIGFVAANWINDDRSHMGLFDYLGALRDTLRLRARMRRLATGSVKTNG
jgi:glycosyltransferase involved in cell wall biosynthesis